MDDETAIVWSANDQKSRELRKMDRLELMAIQNFCSSHLELEDPWPLIENLLILEIIDEDLLKFLVNCKEAGLPFIKLWQILLDDLSFICNFNALVKIIYDRYRADLAKKLFLCHLSILAALGRFTVVGRVDIRNQKVSEFFKHTKKKIHEVKFSHQQLLNFGNILERRIKNEQNETERKLLCDKYIAQLAATSDFMCNTSVSISLQNDVFKKMEMYADKCSNPDLARIILQGRQGDALSTTGEFSEGENFMRTAYVCADKALPCIKITDMYYKNVVFKLAEFEANPTIENQKQVLFESVRALWALSVEDEDLQEFWKRLILLRRAFVFLGVGKHCKIVKNYTPGEENLAEGEAILKDPLLKGMEVRRKMFKSVANARLHYLKCRTADRGQEQEPDDNAIEFIEKAIMYIRKAERHALTGNYSELEKIQEQLRSLEEERQALYLQPGGLSLESRSSSDDTSQTSVLDSKLPRPINFVPGPKLTPTEIQNESWESIPKLKPQGNSLYKTKDFQPLTSLSSSTTSLSEESPLINVSSSGSLSVSPRDTSNITVEFESISGMSPSTDEGSHGPAAMPFSLTDQRGYICAKSNFSHDGKPIENARQHSGAPKCTGEDNYPSDENAAKNAKMPQEPGLSHHNSNLDLAEADSLRLSSFSDN